MIENKMPRRGFLRIAGAALVTMPALVASHQATAATNAAMRTSLKYQGTPLGDKNCATCMQFVPGAKAQDLGGCKIIPGDTEIAPQGYCMAWAKKT